MLIATRKNRQLRIPEEKKNVYASLGYTIKDENGEVLSEPVNPQKEINELKAEIKALKKENAELKAKAGETAEVPAKTATTKKAAAKKEETTSTDA